MAKPARAGSKGAGLSKDTVFMALDGFIEERLQADENVIRVYYFLPSTDKPLEPARNGSGPSDSVKGAGKLMIILENSDKPIEERIPDFRHSLLPDDCDVVPITFREFETSLLHGDSGIRSIMAGGRLLYSRRQAEMRSRS